jgi:hypothetical protein
MSYLLKGKLIEKYETAVISDRFKKRELVVEQKHSAPNGTEYAETIKLQLTQDKCDSLDPFNIGDSIIVQFNLKGKRWEKDGKVNYFNNLDAWKIELDGEAKEAPKEAPKEADNDLPF